MTYALALENPPLLIVSDRLRIEVHTHFNGTPSECHVVRLEDLGDPAKRELLRGCFTAPETFKPARTNRQITEEAANASATTAERLRAAGVPADVTSHLLTQCLFCFFAEDVGLLPGRLFERLVGNPHAAATARAAKHLNDLRERWLNPPEWTRREPEVTPLGMAASPYPDRIVPREGFEAQLAQRTLTRLYNERPAWLAQAHATLDAAYGWADITPDSPDDAILRRLLALNRERAAGGQVMGAEPP